MTQQEIEAGCLELLSADYDTAKRARAGILKTLAAMMNFRPDSLFRASPEINLQRLKKRIHSSDFEFFRDDVIQHWLVGSHRSMLADFLKSSGIPQNNGFVAEDHEGIPSKDSMINGIRGIIGRHPYKPVMMYLGYLIVWGGDTWQNLDPAFHECEELLKQPTDDDGKAHGEGDGLSSVVSDNQQPLPEKSERFTPLDNILIRTAVATAGDDLGSLSVEELKELIDEAVRLNSSRSHSVFHRGFFDALFTDIKGYNSAAENDDRRMWYFTGLLMGMLRWNKTAEILSLIKLRKEIFHKICMDSKSRCGIMLLPSLFPILWECAENELAFELLKGQLPRIPEMERVRMAIMVYENASSIMRLGKAEIAGNFFDLLNRLAKNENNFPDRFREEFLQRNGRRRGQVFMMKGEFPAAFNILEPLVNAEDDELAAEAAGDLALVKGSIRSLQSLFPSMISLENALAAANALKAGLMELESSVAKGGKGGTNARICLGIISLFGPSRDAGKASDEFRSALAGMMERSSLYEIGGVLQWVRLLHSLAILENSDEGGLFQVCDLLKGIRESGEKYPVWILSRMLEASTQFDDKTVAVALADLILAHEGNNAFDAIWQSKLPLEVPELGARYTEWMLTTEGSSKAKWPRCKALLGFMLREGRTKEAASLLDSMEVISNRDKQCAADFLELLEDDGNYSPAWDYGDAELCRINLADKHGKTEEARALLINRFHDKRTAGNPTDILEAEGILEWLEELNEDSGQLETLSRLLRFDDEVADIRGDRLESLGGKILFVGGNETQAQYRADVIREVKTACPHLEIEFINPGWSSNWNKHLDDVRQQLPRMDAVVLSPLVRTQLGRSIRKECDESKPWFPCTGRGKASIVRSVMNAAKWMAVR
jgi:hypothetical protein